jgi:hypothetical protein
MQIAGNTRDTFLRRKSFACEIFLQRRAWIHSLLAAILFVMAVLLPGCGNTNGNTSGSSTQPSTVLVSIQPTSMSLSLGQTLQFQASVNGNADTNVSWMVNGVAGGSADVGIISASGLYTTPAILPNPANVTVTAASQSDPQATASAAVDLEDDVASSGPYIDLHDAPYFANNRAAGPIQSTTCSTNGTTTATCSPVIDFQNNDGITILGAGNSTSQSTPSAPIVTSPTVGGSTTYQYQLAGLDGLRGLTVASSVGQTTSAPAVLGSPAVVISSISQSSGTVTVNTSTPILAAANQQVVISGVAGAGAGLNGTYPIAAVPTGSQFTYSLAGNAGSGTVSSHSTARLENGFNITSMVCTASANTCTVTTAAIHHFIDAGVTAPTEVIIDGVMPGDMNGRFRLTSPTSTTFVITRPTETASTETATAFGTATVYEFNLVTGPAYTGTTIQYCVYGNASGSMTLIGLTLPGDVTFKDYGPFWNSGFSSPDCPSSPPNSTQGQAFSSTIVSGAGTTSLVLASAPPATVSNMPGLHDDGPALVAAAANLAVNGPGGSILLSPRPGPYVFNSPIAPADDPTIIIANSVVINETVFACNWQGDVFGGGGMNGGQFAPGLFQSFYGSGNPMIQCYRGIELSNLAFFTSIPGQTSVLITGSYSILNRILLSTSAFTSTPLVVQGLSYQHNLTDIYATGALPPSFSGNGGLPYQGQIQEAPLLPVIWFKGSTTNTGIPGNVQMNGLNNLQWRGILVDMTNSGGVLAGDYDFENFYTNESIQTPAIAFYGYNNGGGANNITASYIAQDTTFAPIIENLSVLRNVLAEFDDPQCPGTVVTGNPIQDLVADFSVCIGQTQGVYTNTSPYATVFFANLGTPANGTIYYCPDCTVANPCAGDGTGAFAKRLNGVWVCN